MKWSFAGQTIHVRQIINHPDFNKHIGVPGDNDVAILKLDFPLILNSDVQPACLPDPCFAPDETGEIAFVSGWGKIAETSYHMSSVLKFVKVPLVTNADCVSSNTVYTSAEVTSNMVCAGMPAGMFVKIVLVNLILLI